MDATSDEAMPGMTTSEIRQARRKIQNRVNQRALRSRVREKKTADGSIAHPFRVHRWRIDDGNDDMPALKPKQVPKEAKTKSALSNQPALRDQPSQAEEPNSDETHPHGALASISAATAADRRSSAWMNLRYCLLSEHLLHLIHFNVLRGLSYNKKVLRPCAFSECTSTPSITLSHVLPHMPDEKILAALRFPENLAPTNLQLSHPHPSWIDVFPFPEMRDNLIRYEGYFSHADFLTDLLGNLINCLEAACGLPRKSTNALSGSKDGDDAPDRQGLILWGEPYQRDSWEITPGFLRKWCEGGEAVADGCAVTVIRSSS
ncbi:hypothetical protein TGAM01_v210331 [Trichoderma gamsii]|uniref:BZIP domain-containing protein n=1 Tax=Trichoderma gamsii TaxID=398673 RepID=A0A2P4Z953_9HYPO|nr:hypothetical protein TGAM01_v210331 [Trichoderma gamsii]PON20823.1 hypothetical protein TGAM01_v210331 [Trichoderma gamsii]